MTRAGADPGKPRGARRGAPKRDPRFNTALARGLKILSAFRPGEAFLGNAELSARTGIPKATVSRLTFTLAELGYLDYDERIGTYELAPGVLSLGYAALSTLEAPVLARRLMAELANESGGTIGLGIADGLDMTYVEIARGEAGLTRNIFVGMRIPIATSTLGWAYLAGLNAQDRAATMARLAEAMPKQWKKLGARLDAAFAEIERRGFCLAMEAFSPQTCAVGVPFVPVGHSRVLAFNCTGTVFHFTRETLETRWGPKLVRLADQLQGRLVRVEGDATTQRRA